jgi:hypothetical protein
MGVASGGEKAKTRAMTNAVSELGGARFYDDARRDRGWAGAVTLRARGIGSLTVLDIVGADGDLVAYLSLLDHSRLVVQYTGADNREASYRFRWASGYTNGGDVRVQGVLEHR